MTRHLAALVCSWAGVAVTVLACVTAAVAADTLPRLHLAAPVTSLGTPLVGTGLCLESGVGLTAASVLLVVVVVAVSGPVLSSAVGRVTGQREGALPLEEPP